VGARSRPTRFGERKNSTSDLPTSRHIDGWSGGLLRHRVLSKRDGPSGGPGEHIAFRECGGQAPSRYQPVYGLVGYAPRSTLVHDRSEVESRVPAQRLMATCRPTTGSPNHHTVAPYGGVPSARSRAAMGAGLGRGASVPDLRWRRTGLAGRLPVEWFAVGEQAAGRTVIGERCQPDWGVGTLLRRAFGLPICHPSVHTAR
jgi:hypothetical protein